jgi:hypothetical protein
MLLKVLGLAHCLLSLLGKLRACLPWLSRGDTRTHVLKVVVQVPAHEHALESQVLLALWVRKPESELRGHSRKPNGCSGRQQRKR